MDHTAGDYLQLMDRTAGDYNCWITHSVTIYTTFSSEWTARKRTKETGNNRTCKEGFGEQFDSGGSFKESDCIM